MFTQDELKEALHCDPVTGRCTWAARIGQRATPGQEAGSVGDNGYRCIGFGGRVYKAHRLIWFSVHGAWPSGHIDHINGDRDDNRICNLRDATRQVNNQNLRRPTVRNRSGLLGVYKKSTNRFGAALTVDGRTVSLGSFVTPEEAHAAYIQAKRAAHAGCTL